ncbi:hypothetical protein A2767_02085 [Candidatus Roizmanbacteria bacterium RIFCSPHIGHO2_01_FULL_35_10]|uniref:Uncharacterized protein n=1 Tax=Candidatus Roizmanbacteria bacterium RIFCSPLOWO2_01_FULL_35_13 TaxID=1802055 RepID=A0A1F7I795_9BACT|nr:MAG: hypothetical protein A2767_02085 [Candidatus Roizmanbacteria bacterium RIFCSPHIGHO2_01_FULL_35_10]OGK39250.1 MAG: hypothetical protein A3A74_07505 [Candidatus Roizmanbacteria bacterium RIFCSPLOWO2_01_FULL_35_13]
MYPEAKQILEAVPGLIVLLLPIGILGLSAYSFIKNRRKIKSPQNYHSHSEGGKVKTRRNP